MLNFECRAELVKLLLSCRDTLAQAEEAVGDLLPVVSQNGADTDRAGAFQCAQEAENRCDRLRRRLWLNESLGCGPLVGRDLADKVGKCWGLGSDTLKDPGRWVG